MQILYTLPEKVALEGYEGLKRIAIWTSEKLDKPIPEPIKEVLA